MSPPPRTEIDSRLQRLSQAGAGVVATIGGVVLCGWVCDVPVLTGALPGVEATTANAALCFLLAGVALVALAHPTCGPRAYRAAQGLALFVALFGLLTLCEYVLGVDLGMDRIFVGARSALTDDVSQHGMAPTSALNFVLIGMALVVLDVTAAFIVVQALTLVAALISLLTLSGYLYGVEPLYRVVSSTQMAATSAILFLIVCIGVLLARPGRGIVQVLSGHSAGSVVGRRMLPVAVVAPLMIGWLRLQGQLAGYYDARFGIALYALASVTVFSGLVCWTAISLHQMDADRHGAEQRFRLAIESAPSGMLMVDSRGRIVLVNSTAEKLFGYGSGELIGQLVEILLPERYRARHPGYRDSFLAAPAARSMGVGRDLWGLRKDGSEFPIEIGLSPIETAEGAFVLGAIVDISERKRAEAELQQAHEALEQRVEERTKQLHEANKELEAFSYSISHDLRAPLRAVDGFSRILLSEFSESLPEQAREYLHDVRANTQRMGHLVDDLLAFSRLSRQAIKSRPVAVDRLVEQCWNELSCEQQGRHVELRVGELPDCEGDPALLKQVWFNLLSNALKYTGKRETAVIEIGGHNGGPPGEHTYFVKDNGVGFDMRYAGKLFGVFQRLHRSEEYEGTGVGLAIVQRILHRHEGKIWADAKPDQGATFFFTIKN